MVARNEKVSLDYFESCNMAETVFLWIVYLWVIKGGRYQVVTHIGVKSWGY